MKQTKAMSKRVCVCEETNSPQVQHKLSREKEMCVEKQTLHRYNTERYVWRTNYAEVPKKSHQKDICVKNSLLTGTNSFSPEIWFCGEFLCLLRSGGEEVPTYLICGIWRWWYDVLKTNNRCYHFVMPGVSPFACHKVHFSPYHFSRRPTRVLLLLLIALIIYHRVSSVSEWVSSLLVLLLAKLGAEICESLDPKLWTSHKYKGDLLLGAYDNKLLLILKLFTANPIAENTLLPLLVAKPNSRDVGYSGSIFRV